MRPSEVVRRAAAYLERHDVESPLANAETLLQSILRTDRAGLYTRSADLSPADAKAFGGLLCRRCGGDPLQHLTGEQGFRRLVLAVEPGVFVPRPETEVLVDVCLDAIADRSAPVVVDVGTGTGAVALAVKDERPDARVFGTDISPAAVALAQANARTLDIDADFLEGDLVSPVPADLRGRLTLVVSNPPYIRAEETAELPSDVLADPERSLLAGIELTERLLVESLRWLGRDGLVVVEIGARQGDEVASAASRAGFRDVRVLPDLTGRDRVVTARRP